MTRERDSKNRQRTLAKKAHQYSRKFSANTAVIVQDNGQFYLYTSSSCFLPDLVKALNIPIENTFDPDCFDTIRDLKNRGVPAASSPSSSSSLSVSSSNTPANQRHSSPSSSPSPDPQYAHLDQRDLSPSATPSLASSPYASAKQRNSSPSRSPSRSPLFTPSSKYSFQTPPRDYASICSDNPFYADSPPSLLDHTFSLEVAALDNPDTRYSSTFPQNLAESPSSDLHLPLDPKLSERKGDEPSAHPTNKSHDITRRLTRTAKAEKRQSQQVRRNQNGLSSVADRLLSSEYFISRP
ncbi:hypothetical protein F4825DRAFT_418816 [Nemania diffusa]|nr:hypothetical protein F4825DRAFT_418816 [Nemania diffusa]